MTQVLVVSHKNRLLPICHRLRSEGTEADCLIWKNRYEAAWGSKLTSVDRNFREDGPPTTEALESIQKDISQPGWILVSDHPHELSLKAEINYLLGPQEAVGPLRLGAWLSHEGILQGYHLLVVDLGAHLGGQGLWIPGGATLIHIRKDKAVQLAEELLAERILELPEGYCGLVQVDIEPGVDGDLALGAAGLGWGYLQTQAFMAGLSNFGEVLEGHPPHWNDEVRITTVIPVTSPPYPEFGRPANVVDIEPMSPQLRGSAYWYDVSVGNNPSETKTAGLDGFIAVAYGSGNTSGVALQRALQVANAIQFPERQWRPDVGRQVQAVIEAFELNYDLVL